MASNPRISKTLSLPDLTDRFGAPGNPPDGYVLTYNAFDGYYMPKATSKLQVMSFPSANPYQVGAEDVVLTPAHVGTYTVNLPAITTIAVASNGANLPQATINVVSTTGFNPNGNILVLTSAGIQTITYTGITATSFTGCSGGTGTMATNNSVTSLTAPVAGSSIIIKDTTGIALANPIDIVSGANIDGATTQTINTNFGCLRVLYTGSTWVIISRL